MTFANVAVALLIFLANDPGKGFHEATLPAPVMFAGLPCGRNVGVDALNRIRRCTLEPGAFIRGDRVPARSVVFFTEQGAIDKVFLANDARLQGHVCRGGGHDWETRFYPDGQLALCWLAADERIDGVSCRRATVWADLTGGKVGVWFDRSGALRQCEAGNDFTLGRCKVTTGDTVTFDEQRNAVIGKEKCGKPADH